METQETALDDRKVINQARSRACKGKGRRHEKRLVRKIRVVAGTLAGFAALAGSVSNFIAR